MIYIENAYCITDTNKHTLSLIEGEFTNHLTVNYTGSIKKILFLD